MFEPQITYNFQVLAEVKAKLKKGNCKAVWLGDSNSRGFGTDDKLDSSCCALLGYYFGKYGYGGYGFLPLFSTSGWTNSRAITISSDFVTWTPNFAAATGYKGRRTEAVGLSVVRINPSDAVTFSIVTSKGRNTSRVGLVGVNKTGSAVFPYSVSGATSLSGTLSLPGDSDSNISVAWLPPLTKGTNTITISPPSSNAFWLNGLAFLNETGNVFSNHSSHGSRLCEATVETFDQGIYSNSEVGIRNNLVTFDNSPLDLVICQYGQNDVTTSTVSYERFYLGLAALARNCRERNVRLLLILAIKPNIENGSLLTWQEKRAIYFRVLNEFSDTVALLDESAYYNFYEIEENTRTFGSLVVPGFGVANNLKYDELHYTQKRHNILANLLIANLEG